MQSLSTRRKLAALALLALSTLLPAKQVLAEQCQLDSMSQNQWASASTEGENIAELVLLDDPKYDSAHCIDGSPPAYYITPGSGNGADKWFIYHEGGGWCTSLESCAQRAASTLGSSQNYEEFLNLDEKTVGYFSNQEELNPMMYNWNRVYLKYCDGGSFSGTLENAIDYNGTPLYFQGSLIRDVLLEDMNSRGLSEASEVVITGCSAGGLATYLHADWWADSIRGARVVAMPDSGFFADWPGYNEGIKWVFDNMGVADGGLDNSCLAALESTGENWRCMLAEQVSPHIETSVFALQSTYDQWQLAFELGSFAIEDVNAYGQALDESIKGSLLANPANGAMIDSCLRHCQLQYSSGSAMVDTWNLLESPGGVSQGEAFVSWYEGRRGLFEQDRAYPCRSCCQGSRR